MARVTFKYEEWACKAQKGHYADAGIDLRTPKSVSIPAHGSVVIDTGVMADIPEGYYGQLESKSGLNVKHGVVSCGGTIDAGYTGHINVKLYNLSDNPYFFNKGDKVVQMIVQPCVIDGIVGIDILDDSERGDNGFGSTGR